MSDVTVMNTDRLLQFFSYQHLPPALQDMSKLFAELAGEICDNIPAGPERSACLRKLLESKDCAVRAMIEV